MLHHKIPHKPTTIYIPSLPKRTGDSRYIRRTELIAHCLFEQSGTFKNEFKKLGIEAYDYDILNDYGETDYQIDLFAEIEGGGTKENRVSLTK